MLHCLQSNLSQLKGKLQTLEWKWFGNDLSTCKKLRRAVIRWNKISFQQQFRLISRNLFLMFRVTPPFKRGEITYILKQYRIWPSLYYCVTKNWHLTSRNDKTCFQTGNNLFLLANLLLKTNKKGEKSNALGATPESVHYTCWGFPTQVMNSTNNLTDYWAIHRTSQVVGVKMYILAIDGRLSGRSLINLLINLKI